MTTTLMVAMGRCRSGSWRARDASLHVCPGRASCDHLAVRSDHVGIVGGSRWVTEACDTTSAVRSRGNGGGTALRWSA